MLRAVIISPDKDLADRLENVLYEVGRVGIVRRLDRHPAEADLARFLRVHAPEVVFLGVDSVVAAQEMVAAIESYVPGLQVVAVSRVCDPKVLLELMRCGVREFLSSPFDIAAVGLAVDRLAQQLQKRPALVDRTNSVFSFLPAKAGVGTSILAANTAATFARESGQRTLLADFDLNSGITRFLLKIENSRSILDAAQLASQLDDSVWPQVVTTFGQLDVIHSGAMNPSYRFEPSQLRQLLEFARRTYKAVCVDMSGNMEKYSIDLMHESKRIYLVTTQEIPALHLAREKVAFLNSLELGDRVSIVLNRCQKRGGVPEERIEEVLGVPVDATIPNDYPGVMRALTSAKFIEPGTDLGKKISALAQKFSDRPKAIDSTKKRFIEYFSLVPARYGSEGGKRAG